MAMATGRKGIAGAPGAAAASAANNAPMAVLPETLELQARLVAHLQQHDEGVSDEDIKAEFGDSYSSLVGILNHLLHLNRLQLFKLGGGMLVYKLIREETAVKFEGLAPEQMLVYQVCEKAADKGIWTRDIKMATNIPQHTLTKTLKILEQRSLIKSVRSVVSKSKKLYMLFDTTPAKEITGGPWYTDQEFDKPFVDHLRNHIVELVKKRGMSDLNEINTDLITSKVSSVQLSMEELENLVNTLVYDGKLEEVSREFYEKCTGDGSSSSSSGSSSSSSSSGGGRGSKMELAYENDEEDDDDDDDEEDDDDEDDDEPPAKTRKGDGGAARRGAAARKAGAGRAGVRAPSTRSGVAHTGRSRTLYRACPELTCESDTLNWLTSAPCGVCPVASRCCEGGIISPQTCEYFKRWIETTPEQAAAAAAAAAMQERGDGGGGMPHT